MLLLLKMNHYNLKDTAKRKRRIRLISLLFLGALAVSSAGCQRTPTEDPRLISLKEDAIAAYKGKDRKGALEKFQQILSEYPNEGECLAYVGRCQRDLGRGELAEATFSKALQIDPHNAHAHLGLGILLYDNEKYRQAADRLKLAIENDPELAEAYRFQGLSYLRLKQMRDSFAHFTKAVEISPDDSVARNNLAAIYMVDKEYDKAIEHLEAALRTSPDYANAISNLAVCYYRKGMFEEAAAGYEKLVPLTPESASVFYALGTAYRDAGHFEKAAQAFETVLRLAPDAENAEDVRAAIDKFRKRVEEEASNQAE